MSRLASRAAQSFMSHVPAGLADTDDSATHPGALPYNPPFNG